MTPGLAVEIALVAVLLACGAVWIVSFEARIAALEQEQKALKDWLASLQRAAVPATIRRELMTAVRAARSVPINQQ